MRFTYSQLFYLFIIWYSHLSFHEILNSSILECIFGHLIHSVELHIIYRLFPYCRLWLLVLTALHLFIDEALAVFEAASFKKIIRQICAPKYDSAVSLDD